MTQFSLFDEPAPVAAPLYGSNRPLPPAIRQPPAIIMHGQAIDDTYPLGLKPLRVINPDWLEVLITEEQFADAKAISDPNDSDDFILLKMLVERGVRSDPCTDHTIAELYRYVAGQYIIRKRTVPGYRLTCRQSPLPPKKDNTAPPDNPL